MKRIILSHGAIAGAIIIGVIALGQLLASRDGSAEAAGSEWLGYLIMIVALSLIFIGIKRYRDRELGGVIKFGTATRLGLGIALVAGVIYVVGWEVNLSLTDYAFIDDYTASVIAAKEANGVSGDELQKVVDDMEVMKTRYARAIYRLPMTFMEIFPVGLLVTLISAGLLRNSRFMAASG